MYTAGTSNSRLVAKLKADTAKKTLRKRDRNPSSPCFGLAGMRVPPRSPLPQVPLGQLSQVRSRRDHSTISPTRKLSFEKGDLGFFLGGRTPKKDVVRSGQPRP